MNLNIGPAVLVVIALSALAYIAASPTPKPSPAPPVPTLSKGGVLQKEFDPEFGVVCYWFKDGTRYLACLQVAPTAADLDLEDAGPEEESIEGVKYVF